ncbi:hypothetical protein ACH4D5_15260 [Streptomyces sp. NPDC018029]|uniref:hypothetical protein n=1 Tax=Streptomyces sp. NPDC018029 TaxID=3365032 RepID=UPI0037A0ECD4
MNNSKRMLTALTLAAAAVAATAPAHAAAAASPEEGQGNVGRAVGETLMDPIEKGQQVMDAGKIALSVVDTGLKSVRTSTQAATTGR